VQVTRKRKIGSGLIVGSLALLAFAVLLVFGNYTFVMTEAQLQEKIDAKLPMRNAAGNVEVTEAKVSLGENDLTVFLVMNGERLRQKFDLVAQSTGRPYYSSGEFFFKAEKVEIKEFSFRDGSLTDKIRRAGERYIDGPRARRFVKDAAPKVEAWVKERAERGAVYALERIPIYRITEKTKWGPVIRATLEKVEVKGNELHIHLSVWQLTLNVLIVLAIAVVVLIFAIGLLRGAGGIFVVVGG
jgi:hypothetical protein